MLVHLHVTAKLRRLLSSPEDVGDKEEGYFLEGRGCDLEFLECHAVRVKHGDDAGRGSPPRFGPVTLEGVHACPDGNAKRVFVGDLNLERAPVVVLDGDDPCRSRKSNERHQKAHQ